MKKRFTDTEKWLDPWFRKLPIKLKCAWMYILDKCDNCGVWKCDYELMGFTIGEEITEKEFYETFENRLYKINDGKIWIKNYIDFQIGELSEHCNPHKQVIELLKKHGIFDIFKGTARVKNISGTLQDIDKDKEKEEEEKKSYRENVFLKEKEHNKLLDKYGKKGVDSLYNKLSAYKMQNNKKYKSDYGAINNWVIDSVKPEEIKYKKKQWLCVKCGKQKASTTCIYCGNATDDDKPEEL